MFGFIFVFVCFDCMGCMLWFGSFLVDGSGFVVFNGGSGLMVLVVDCVRIEVVFGLGFGGVWGVVEVVELWFE